MRRAGLPGPRYFLSGGWPPAPPHLGPAPPPSGPRRRAAAAMKKFFQEIKADIKFKSAGPGQKLTDSAGCVMPAGRRGRRRQWSGEGRREARDPSQRCRVGADGRAECAYGRGLGVPVVGVAVVLGVGGAGGQGGVAWAWIPTVPAGGKGRDDARSGVEEPLGAGPGRDRG